MLKRNFNHLDIYLNKLIQDIYPQPEDAGHTGMANDLFEKWIAPYPTNTKNVLDVGCGDTAFMSQWFEDVGIEYTGVALGGNHPKVVHEDFSFLPFEDGQFDMVFSRHSLEHSPMPLISLMEWHRVSNHLLCLILPNPDHFGWAGQNHYSMLHPNQVEFLLGRAGWNIVWTDFEERQELRYMCEKVRGTEYDKKHGDK